MIFLTGATGFIGRHVLGLLLEQGDTVVTFGRSAPRPVAPAHAARHRHVTGDLATGDNLAQLPWAEIRQVIHLAAAGVKASRRAWPEALAVNVVGTQHLLAAVSAAPLRPRVFIARTFYEDLVEQSPAMLDNPYIATKHAATQLARLFAQSYAGGLVFGTFFQVYGPGDDPGNVLSYAAREFQAGRTPVFGSCKGLRDWIYITDAADAVLACLAAPPADYDIGTGQLISIREIIQTLAAQTNSPAAPVFDPARDRGDADFTLAARTLPPIWHPAVDIPSGLSHLLSHYIL
jgi:UDP-glucose 4-epimerase